MHPAARVWLLAVAFFGGYGVLRVASCGGAPTPTPQDVTLVRVDGGFMTCTTFLEYDKVQAGDAGAKE